MGCFPWTRNRAIDHHRTRIVPFVEGNIILPTLFAQVSTLTLPSITQDEAFSIWTDWASLYPPGSKERELLEGVRDTRYLVNVTHHDFKNPDALWNFLFEDLPVEPEAALGER